MNIKILVVNIHNGDVIMPPVQMRAEQGWTVGRLKIEIGKVTRIPPKLSSLHTQRANYQYIIIITVFTWRT